MEKKGVKNSKFVISVFVLTSIVLFALVFLSFKVSAGTNTNNAPAPSSTTYSWFGELEYFGSPSNCSVTVPLYYKAKPGLTKETLVAPVIAFDNGVLSYAGFEFENLNPPLVNHENSYMRPEGKRFGVNNYLTLRITRKDKSLKDDAEHIVPSTKLGILSFAVKDTSVSSPIRLYFVSTSHNRNRKTSILVDNTAHKKKELEVNVLNNCGQPDANTTSTPSPSPSPAQTQPSTSESSPLFEHLNAGKTAQVRFNSGDSRIFAGAVYEFTFLKEKELLKIKVILSDKSSVYTVPLKNLEEILNSKDKLIKVLNGEFSFDDTTFKEVNGKITGVYVLDSSLKPISSPTSSPTSSPSPVPALTPTPSPSQTQTPVPTPTPSPTPSPTPQPTPVPTPSPTKTPKPTRVPPVCEETDGGLDSFVKGIVTLTYGGKKTEYPDVCNSDGKSLSESFCTGGGRGAARYVCKFGCEDGACKKK